MSSSKAIKAGIGYTIGNYLLKGLAFLTLPIYSRLLSTEDFGDYSVFLSYETILFIILGFAIHSSFKNAKYRYDSEDSQEGMSYSQYISVAMVLLVVSAGAWLLIANLIYPLVSGYLGIDRLSMNLLVLFSYSTAVITCFNADSSLSYKYDSYLWISGINAVGNTLLSILLIVTALNQNRYIGRVIGTVVPSLILSIVIAIRYLTKEKPRNSKEYLKWGLVYSSPIIFHGISQVILGQFDRIMIKNIIDSSAAGIYSFAYNIFMIISVTSTSLDNVWSTWAYSKLNAKDYDAVKKYSAYYMLGMLVFSLLVMMVSPELIMILGGEKYAEAKYIVLPIITAGYFSFLYTIPATAEYYTEKTGYMAVSTVAAAAINIALNAFFINAYGYVAAAYTTLVTYVLYFLFHILTAKKIMPEFCISLKTVVTASVVVILANFAIMMLIDQWLLRWAIALVLFCVLVIVEEKKFCFIKKKLRKGA